jgi:hypothetical protein
MHDGDVVVMVLKHTATDTQTHRHTDRGQNINKGTITKRVERKEKERRGKKTHTHTRKEAHDRILGLLASSSKHSDTLSHTHGPPRHTKRAPNQSQSRAL